MLTLKHYISPTDDPDWQKGFIVLAPCNAKILPLSEHPDPLIANGYLGAGVCYHAFGNQIVSPVSGTIIDIADAMREITIQADNGLKLKLGFIWQVEQIMCQSIKLIIKLNQKIVKGQTLFEYNQALLAQLLEHKIGYCTVTNCNAEKTKIIPFYHQVIAGQDPIFSIRSI